MHECPLPDPALDELSLWNCPACRARYIRLHFADFYPGWRYVTPTWVRLKWWQRF